MTDKEKPPAAATGRGQDQEQAGLCLRFYCNLKPRAESSPLGVFHG
jgi:hypothetical protein